MPPKNPAKKPKKNRISVPGTGACTDELLLEIGTEELPANYLAYAGNPENRLFEKAFEETLKKFEPIGLRSSGQIKVYLTPRRVVLHVQNIAFDLTPVAVKVPGPSMEQAYTADKKPTPALLGFLKSKGFELKDTVEMEHRGKRCIGVERKETPKSFEQYLVREGFVKNYLAALTFPKLMHWDGSDLRFPRPIRTILCLLNDRALSFKVGEIASGATTLFFRNGARTSQRVTSASQYFALLKKNGVILDAGERRLKIEDDVKALTKKYGGKYMPDQGLLDEVTFLTESPVAVSSTYDGTFSYLPPEVLTVSLSKKQRLFSVIDANGRHLPYFIGVLDGAVKDSKLVARTIAAILKAKLQDSHFFYQEDLKLYGNPAGVERLASGLKHLVYLRGMGSTAEKLARLEKITSITTDWGLLSSDCIALKKALYHSKLDLQTQMVGEFPELQGIMGSTYSRHAGESEEVSRAVREHYLPAGLNTDLPGSRLGAALSILDKADLIACCFAAGNIPSASQDPYALKRSLNGIFRIVVAHQLKFNWQALVQQILTTAKEQRLQTEFNLDECVKKLKAFYRERMQNFFENQGYDAELVQAVLASGGDSIFSVDSRLKALTQIAGADAYKKTLKIIQRTSNILKSVNGNFSPAIDPQHFETDMERQLFEALNTHQKSIKKAVESADYQKATSLYASAFFDILHLFFEQVLVNADKPEIRLNRLSLLSSVRSLYTRDIADLSKIKWNPDLDVRSA